MTAAITRGIVRAHVDGIVTSCSVLGNCEDLDETARALRDTPALGAGAHLTLATGAPVSPPQHVPSLVDETGRFASGWRHLLPRLSRMRASDIEREFDAQLERLRAAGIALDHVDTHQHIGMWPSVRAIVHRAAARHGIPATRRALAKPFAWTTRPGRAMAASLLRALRRESGDARGAAITWGFEQSGRLNEAALLEIVRRLGPGDHELLCHPGSAAETVPADPTWRYDWLGELAALTSPSVRSALSDAGVVLCRWADLRQGAVR